MKHKLKLTDKRSNFKPFNYPWCYDAFLQSEQMHWLHSEVPLQEDVVDWKNKLTQAEKDFLMHLFRFFTQADCFHPSTEILTSNGWKYFYNLDDKDEVAQVTEDKSVEFIKPLKIILKRSPKLILLNCK